MNGLKKCSNRIIVRSTKDTYERYNGYYAQNEMGYSDDEIDTVFDGDPSAYWTSIKTSVDFKRDKL